jgi:DNA replication initiation complex subunit (GINS family)
MADPFTQLLEWRRNELAVRGLAKISPEFYSTTAAYLAELRRSYEGELRENPSGRKGEISRQTYQRAIQVARDIVEGRAQKVLNAAFQASVGGSRDLPNALTEERALFDRFLDALLEHRRSSAPYIEPTLPTSPPPSVRPPEPSSLAAPPAAPAPVPPAAAPAVPPMARPRPTLVYVRILKDSRPIEVGAETIDLKADDLLSLPPETAKILVEAKVAEPVENSPIRPVT